jgi:uncharacterized protein YqjF (DUF2071 family)
MNATTQSNLTCLPSEQAQRRMLSQFGEPIHFEVDAEALQRDVPFELDLWNGKAFVSLVAFTMRGMRPRFGGKWTALLFRPIATHHFLNVRTYVRHGDEYGIHFIAEWLTNRLAVMLGPRTFGLPYRYGRISYHCDLESGSYCGRITDANKSTALTFEARVERPFHGPVEHCCPKTLPHPSTLRSITIPRLSEEPGSVRALKDNGAGGATEDGLGEGESSSDGWLRQKTAQFAKSIAFHPCVAGSLDEWLMERYIAFNSAKGIRRFFRVWHPPWPQAAAEVALEENSLLIKNWNWFEDARMIGANLSPGFDEVWMGRPHKVP